MMGDEEGNRVGEIRREVSKLLEELATIREEEQCYIMAWALVYEATSMDMESEGLGLRGVFVADHQLISTSVGLGSFLNTYFDISAAD